MEFLKPTGIDSPLAISRCVWLSVVRAPIALQLSRSAMYCGTIGSSSSVPAGKPEARDVEQQAARDAQARAACRSSRSRCGSLISPFQPIVVRGFSKYTRITTRSVSRHAAGELRQPPA